MRVKNLSMVSIDRLKHYLEHYCQLGCMVSLSPNGYTLYLDYVEGVCKQIQDKPHLANITHLPAIIPSKKSFKVTVVVTTHDDALRQMNFDLVRKGIRKFTTKQEMITRYIEEGIPNESESTGLYAYAIDSDIDSNSWLALTKLSSYGFKLSMIVELLYGNSLEKLDALKATINETARRANRMGQSFTALTLSDYPESQLKLYVPFEYISKAINRSDFF